MGSGGVAPPPISVSKKGGGSPNPKRRGWVGGWVGRWVGGKPSNPKTSGWVGGWVGNPQTLTGVGPKRSGWVGGKLSIPKRSGWVGGWVGNPQTQKGVVQCLKCSSPSQWNGIQLTAFQAIFDQKEDPCTTTHPRTLNSRITYTPIA